MNSKQLDMLCSAVFLVFGGVMLKFSLSIRHIIPTDVGSGYVPIFLSVCILAAAGAKLVLTLLDRKPAKAAAKSDSDLAGGLGTVGLMLLYVIAFEPVGFLLSSMAYLFAQILLMSSKGNRKPVLFAVISVTLPLGIALLFAYVIKMPLPVGILGF